MTNIHNITDIIPNFYDLSDKKKMSTCINKLIKVEQKIYKFEDKMFKSWEEVEQLFEFKDKLDYFDYMTSTKKFAKLMHKKSILETYIYNNNKVIFSDSDYEEENEEENKENKENKENEIDLFDF
jgi:hypothetical protein